MLVGYARASKAENENTSAQIETLKAEGCDEIFEEASTSGRWDRPELKRMLGQLRAQDIVIVCQIDRLATSLRDLVFLLEAIDKKGEYLRSISESVDTSGPAGRMLMQMLGSFAGFERAQVKERTREGQNAARARGLGGGRSPKLSPAQQREILDMLAAGRPAAELARLFRVHRATISRLASKDQRRTIAGTDDVR